MFSAIFVHKKRACLARYVSGSNRMHLRKSLALAFFAAGIVLAALSAAYCRKEAGTNNPNASGTESEFKDCARLAVPPDMKCIPGGPFLRGDNRKVRKLDTGRVVRDEAPPTKIVISTFFMDTYEVTFSQHEECVQAGGCKPARTNYGRRYSQPNQPKVGVNWYNAREYCLWRGKRLPTEAEWEKAARGPNGELYPWGNAPADCDKAIILSKGIKGCGKLTTWDVGSRPAFRYGLHDMAGNAHEWVNDWYSKSYQACGADCAGRDPQGPCGGADRCPGHSRKVVRGGSWWWPGEVARSSWRRPHYPMNKPYHHFGFRCAKSP